MISVPVSDASQVADVRRRTMMMAAEIGFSEVAAGRVGIVATELTTNLLKFGIGAEILFGVYEDETGAGIELLSLDRGPGIRSVAPLMRDGYSTSGSAGSGLGAIRRLSRSFDIVSWPNVGTGILARIGAGDGLEQTASLPCWGTIVVPVKGETLCGDAVAARACDDGWVTFAADGLGHGPQAAAASSEAVRLFLKAADRPLAAILTAVHEGLRHTRGAAVAVCRYRRSDDHVHYCGIGNIEARILDGGETKRLVSHAGTAGHAVRRVQEFRYPFKRSSTLIMHSDGLTSTWSLNAMTGFANVHPTLAAAVLYRQFGRDRDDACVIVANADART